MKTLSLKLDDKIFDEAEENARVPTLTLVGPVYALAPPSIIVPAPDLVKPLAMRFADVLINFAETIKSEFASPVTSGTLKVVTCPAVAF